MSYAIPITPDELIAYQELRARCNSRVHAGETKRQVLPDYEDGLHAIVGNAAKLIIEGRGHFHVPGDWHKIPARS